MALVGATVMDGTGGAPVHDAVVTIRGGRVVSAGTEPAPQNAEMVDVTGKFVIPGLLDANVHLALAPFEEMVKNVECYHEMALEAAKVTLRGGVTTVFDTYGPLEPLVQARDAIDSGDAVGSRIFAAGNIIGFAGPLSPDFFADGSKVVNKETLERINRIWDAGVGSDLLYLSMNDLRKRIRSYLDRGLVNFVKYGSSGHVQEDHLLFSERAQHAIVEETHARALTVQAHTTSPESLWMAVDAGVDLIQHPDVTGPHPIPEDTLDLLVEQQVGCAALVQTDAMLAWKASKDDSNGADTTADKNNRRLIEAGARLLLTTDSYLVQSRYRHDPRLGPRINGAPDMLGELGEGHFRWLMAVHERGMRPMDALLAATRNVALAYGKADELGTLEPGKRADLVVLDADPLDKPQNYRQITAVMKDGIFIDRDALPSSPLSPASR
ncbi:amidohydrolase family protein [Amycolatopsis jejuensis]|uniref:amidohydrolase family protein n=1 Tax=Amycolatopsis jejuensis TaxID=330084 RepID=UPI000527EEA8|nr:amidohydrolase family protein [Amycolatopsis jejuensis]